MTASISKRVAVADRGVLGLDHQPEQPPPIGHVDLHDGPSGHLARVDAAVEPPHERLGIELVGEGSPNAWRAPHSAMPNTMGRRSSPAGVRS